MEKCPGNPGISVAGTTAFANGERTWTESFELIRLATDVLRARGHEVVNHDTWIEHRSSGYVLQPLMVSIEPLERGGVHTVSTIDVRHPRLIRDGLFEYQHSTGDDVTESFTKGFESWESVDLSVLLDALRPKPEASTVWEMTLPEKEGLPSRVRRAVLGNVLYYAQSPSLERAPDGPGQDGEEHPFCNCCFLTRNYEAFRSHLEGDETYGVRFYAMRDEAGQPGADCRVNGEDYQQGIEALRSYVTTWPGSGVEYRKQYVIMYTVDPEQP